MILEKVEPNVPEIQHDIAGIHVVGRCPIECEPPKILTQAAAYIEEGMALLQTHHHRFILGALE